MYFYITFTVGGISLMNKKNLLTANKWILNCTEDCDSRWKQVPIMGLNSREEFKLSN